MTINQDTIYIDSFEKSQKNNLTHLGCKQTIDNFIDFNLLKQYSIKEGIPNSEAYISQFNKETDKLKDSIYYSKEQLEPILKYYFKKLQTERKVQLLLFKTEILPSKNIDKYTNSVLKQINNEASNFKKAVEQYSSIQQYKTPLYLDVFSINRPLLDAIYSAPLNQVMEFKAPNNEYYLILVTKERKYLGNVVLDQISINNSSKNGEKEAELVYNGIKNSEDFAEAKSKYSKNIEQEKSFYTDITNDTLYNYILNVKEPTVFPPIKVKDGYKIYKYLFRDSFDDYNNTKNIILERLKKSDEINILNNKLAQELREKSFFKENKDNLTKFYKSFPASYEDFQKKKIDKVTELVIIGNEFKLTDKDLLEQLKQLPKEKYIDIKPTTQYIINDWENKALINYYNLHYKELDRNLEAVKNMKDQLLIKFALMNITKEAQKDIEGQKEFLEKQANRLTWKERIEGTLYYCLNSEVEKKVLQMLDSGKTSQDIEKYFNRKTDSEKNVLLIINRGKFTRESVNLPLKEELTKKIYTTDYKTGKLVISIGKIIKNDRMTLKELQTTYINEYIDYKTSATIEQLRKEAVIHINNTQQDYLQKKYGL